MNSSTQGFAKKPVGRDWKRRYPRFRMNLPIKVTVLCSDGYQEVRGRSGDIGEGGLGVVLVSEISQGEVIALEIQMPDGPAVDARAIVRYREGLHHGLEFLGLSDEQRATIRSLCAAATPLE